MTRFLMLLSPVMAVAFLVLAVLALVTGVVGAGVHLLCLSAVFVAFYFWFRNEWSRELDSWDKDHRK